VTATFVMPMLGADMAAGRLAQWYRAPGDRVARGDIVASVETDKGVIDVECFATGVIGAQLVSEGQEVAVGTPLATILGEGEVLAQVESPRPPVAVPRLPEAPSEPRPPVASAPPPAPPAAEPAAGLHRHASPLALRFARDHGIDIASIAGTGPHGRTLLRDVDAALPHPGVQRAAPSHVRSTPRSRELAARLGLDIATLTGSGPNGRVMRKDVEAAQPAPVDDQRTRMRRAIAAAMSRSNREIPHYYVGETIDLGRASEWLTAENGQRPLPERLLIGVLLVKAVALALRQHPALNAVWQDERAATRDEIHVGVAVSLREGGLIAPAVHNADGCSLGELMASFRDVVGRARRGGLRASELSDPTITVTSLGEGGAEEVYGVIFPPQVALVGFGRVVVRPWVVDGVVVPRPIVRATLSADHRASDGHAGSAFLRTLDRLLQEPAAL
jgi:pyruvate dehydrogenase E2 component (dihydrolipoamide acetyltransferase)